MIGNTLQLMTSFNIPPTAMALSLKAISTRRLISRHSLEPTTGGKQHNDAYYPFRLIRS